MGRVALTILVCVGAAGAQNSGHGRQTVLNTPKQLSATARGENIVEPVPLMRCQQPQVTEEALVAHLAGLVTMSLTVDDDGKPHDIHVVNPLGLGLDESAAFCMGQSRYSPAQKDGKPVPLKMNVSLVFPDRGDSDWHLGKIAFQTPEGVSRPVFVKARYPGSSADKRGETACIHFTIDKSGMPADVQLSAAQDANLDKQAVAIANGFRFKPGAKGGQPVAAPATLNLVHGAPNRAPANSHEPQ